MSKKKVNEAIVEIEKAQDVLGELKKHIVLEISKAKASSLGVQLEKALDLLEEAKHDGE